VDEVPREFLACPALRRDTRRRLEPSVVNGDARESAIRSHGGREFCGVRDALKDAAARGRSRGGRMRKNRQRLWQYLMAADFRVCAHGRRAWPPGGNGIGRWISVRAIRDCFERVRARIATLVVCDQSLAPRCSGGDHRISIRDVWVAPGPVQLADGAWTAFAALRATFALQLPAGAVATSASGVPERSARFVRSGCRARDRLATAVDVVSGREVRHDALWPKAPLVDDAARRARETWSFDTRFRPRRVSAGRLTGGSSRLAVLLAVRFFAKEPAPPIVDAASAGALPLGDVEVVPGDVRVKEGEDARRRSPARGNIA